MKINLALSPSHLVMYDLLVYSSFDQLMIDIKNIPIMPTAAIYPSNDDDVIHTLRIKPRFLLLMVVTGLCFTWNDIVIGQKMLFIILFAFNIEFFLFFGFIIIINWSSSWIDRLECHISEILLHCELILNRKSLQKYYSIKMERFFLPFIRINWNPSPQISQFDVSIWSVLKIVKEKKSETKRVK